MKAVTGKFGQFAQIPNVVDGCGQSHQLEESGHLTF